MTDILSLTGYIGMSLVLLTLLLSRTHYKESQMVSIVGGILLATSAYLNGPSAYPFFFLNFIWTLISIYNLWKIRSHKHVKRKA